MSADKNWIFINVSVYRIAVHSYLIIHDNFFNAKVHCRELVLVIADIIEVFGVS